MRSLSYPASAKAASSMLEEDASALLKKDFTIDYKIFFFNFLDNNHSFTR